MPFFDDADLKSFKPQLAAVMKIFFVYEERSPKYGQFAELLLQIQQKYMNEEQLNELMEINEQRLSDAELNNKDFVPTSSKKVIKLKKRMDLKNRTLVKQLRDMFAVRRLINEVSHHYLEDCEKINDRTAHMFRQWISMCTKMNSMNDMVMSFDGNLLSQFQMVADCCLDGEALLNPLLT